MTNAETAFIPDSRGSVDHIMQPGISVVIPVYNVAKYLDRCLDSVFSQDFDSFEVICVDDGSTDGSSDILARRCAARENARIIRKENGGLSSARNAGLDVAQGVYVLFVDSDDALMHADALSRMYARAEEAQADFLIFGGEPEYETEELAREKAYLKTFLHRAGTYPDGLPGQELFIRMVEGNDYVPSAWLQLFRRELIEKNDLRFADGLLFEDQLFTLQYLSLARRTAQLDGHYYLYYIREGSIMTASRADRSAHSYYTLSALLDAFYNERLVGASAAFQKHYRARIRMLAHSGTDCLRALSWPERRAFLRRLEKPARRIAQRDLALLPLRQLRRRCRKLRKRIRRARS